MEARPARLIVAVAAILAGCGLGTVGMLQEAPLPDRDAAADADAAPDVVDAATADVTVCDDATTSCSDAAPVFDPATLPLTGWWRAPYTGSPWVGTPSAGSSGTRNLVEGTTAPSTGAARNGFTPADFDGVDDILRTGTLQDFVTTTSGSIWCLFHADGGKPPSPGAPHLLPALLSDSSASIALSYSSDGVVASIANGDAFAEASVPADIAGYHLAQMTWDGATLRLRVDAGSWSSVPAGPLAGLAGYVYAGSNYSGGSRYDGRALEFGITDQALTDQVFDGIKSYINGRYGLSL